MNLPWLPVSFCVDCPASTSVVLLITVLVSPLLPSPPLTSPPLPSLLPPPPTPLPWPFLKTPTSQSRHACVSSSPIWMALPSESSTHCHSARGRSSHPLRSPYVQRPPSDPCQELSIPGSSEALPRLTDPRPTESASNKVPGSADTLRPAKPGSSRQGNLLLRGRPCLGP